MRRSNWPRRLHDYIQQCLDAPFQWGVFDCCTFAANCCVQICGIDPIEQYRDRYSSELGAKRLIVSLHGSMPAIWDASFHRIEPQYAQRGDVVAFNGPQGLTVGVIWGNGIYSTAEDGVCELQETPIMAWRVG
ncbi:DUF6950 family protein [Carnimonas bestiolae]|uniref:DUF6950 family protein n=1 Tax=Carnimonas bestiolae TaxID=3402172 RepID=UPI003EDB8538